MTPRQRTLKLVEEHRAELLDDSAGTDTLLTVYSPTGSAWRATNCHTISVAHYTDRPGAWRALAEDLAGGLIACDEEDCELCEDQGAPGDR